jgi:hypothetical protein
MIDALTHALGCCPDAHSHANLMTLLAGGALGVLSLAGSYFRHIFRWKTGC